MHNALATLLLLVSVPAQAQWYGSIDGQVPYRTLFESRNVFQRNQTEVLDAMGMGTGMFEVGSDTMLKMPNLDFITGGRATVGYWNGAIGLQASYMTTDKWTEGASVTDPMGMLAAPFGISGSAVGDPVGVLDNNSFASIHYTTEMESLEAHLCCLAATTDRGEARALFGVRAMAIDETFRYDSTNATSMTRTKNRILGPQGGIQAWAFAPGGRVELACKTAVTYNEIERLTGSVLLSDPEVTFIGDVDIKYRAQPTDCISLDIGYKLLGLLNVGNAATSYDEDIAYHLPYAGITINH